MGGAQRLPVPPLFALRSEEPMRKEENKKRISEDQLTTWLFLMPALIIVLVAVIIPLCNSFVLSFEKVRINVPGFIPQFVGLENYLRMLDDPVFIRSVQNTAFLPLRQFLWSWYLA